MAFIHTAPRELGGVLRSRLRDARIERASKISTHLGFAEIGYLARRGIKNAIAICLNFDANKVGKGPHKRAEVVALKDGS
jgi:hypothetical protein